MRRAKGEGRGARGDGAGRRKAEGGTGRIRTGVLAVLETARDDPCATAPPRPHPRDSGCRREGTRGPAGRRDPEADARPPWRPRPEPPRRPRWGVPAVDEERPAGPWVLDP